MRTKSALLFLALILAASAWGLSRATEPPRAAGKVLVLENERTLEGDIERVGDQYRVRRSVGETWVPADKVKRLCATLEDAYGYLRAQANLADADEHLRLGQWCQLHGLREQALAEVKEAVALRPGHVPSQRLLANLQNNARAMTAAPSAGGSEESDLGPSPALDVDAESQAVFATKVQPILMNACASCHAAGRAGALKLARVHGAAQANRRLTQHNLASVLAHLNPERPEASPLLLKAASIHGDMPQAPLKSRQAPAYRTLEDWAKTVAANNPQLRERYRGPAAVAAGPEAAPVKSEVVPGAAARPVSVSQPVQAAPAAPPSEGQPVVPLDPFDPLIFNRQMHPQRQGPEKK